MICHADHRLMLMLVMLVSRKHRRRCKLGESKVEGICKCQLHEFLGFCCNFYDNLVDTRSADPVLCSVEIWIPWGPNSGLKKHGEVKVSRDSLNTTWIYKCFSSLLEIVCLSERWTIQRLSFLGGSTWLCLGDRFTKTLQFARKAFSRFNPVFWFCKRYHSSSLQATVKCMKQHLKWSPLQLWTAWISTWDFGSKKLKHVEVRHIEAAHTMLDPTIVPDTVLKHCMPHSLTETAKPAQDETRARQHIQWNNWCCHTLWALLAKAFCGQNTPAKLRSFSFEQ